MTAATLPPVRTKFHARRESPTNAVGRALAALREAGPVGLSSWALMEAARTVDPATIARELRANKHTVVCERVGRGLYYYRLVDEVTP